MPRKNSRKTVRGTGDSFYKNSAVLIIDAFGLVISLFGASLMISLIIGDVMHGISIYGESYGPATLTELATTMPWVAVAFLVMLLTLSYVFLIRISSGIGNGPSILNKWSPLKSIKFLGLVLLAGVTLTTLTGISSNFQDIAVAEDLQSYRKYSNRFKIKGEVRRVNKSKIIAINEEQEVAYDIKLSESTTADESRDIEVGDEIAVYLKDPINDIVEEAAEVLADYEETQPNPVLDTAIGDFGGVYIDETTNEVVREKTEEELAQDVEEAQKTDLYAEIEKINDEYSEDTGITVEVDKNNDIVVDVEPEKLDTIAIVDDGKEDVVIETPDPEPSEPVAGEPGTTQPPTDEIPTTDPTTPDQPSEPSPVDSTPPQSGYDDNLAMILSNSTRETRYDDHNNNTPQNQLDIQSYLRPASERPAWAEWPPFNESNVGGSGIWHEDCGFSHFAYDDPIVFPNQPGASHLHMFFGNTHANAYSTDSSIVNEGNSTCNRQEFNRTSYWVPALLDGANRVLVTDEVQIYYEQHGYPASGSLVNPFPDGLKMVFGNSAIAPDVPSTSDETPAYWRCGWFEHANRNTGSGRASESQTTIPYCDPATYSHIQMDIITPACWNPSAGLYQSDGSHVAYTTRSWSRECPSTHPYRMPRMTYRVHFEIGSHVTDQPTSNFHLSSDVQSNGAIRSSRGATLHGDWYNGWETNHQRDLVDLCHETATDSTRRTCQPPDVSWEHADSVWPGLHYRPDQPSFPISLLDSLCPGVASPATTAQAATCNNRR